MSREEEIAFYSFGRLFIDEEEPLYFEYHGEEVKIPYHVEGLAKGVLSDFAWFLFVDGLPIWTRIESFDGEPLREYSLFHHFALEYQQRYEFYIIFRPISGNSGDILPVIGSSMLNPDFLPENRKNNIFGFNHQVISATPIELKIHIDSNEFNQLFNSNTIQTPIDEEILEFEKSFKGQDINFLNSLISFQRMWKLPSDSMMSLPYENSLFVNNGLLSFLFLAYGGLGYEQNIYFYINHELQEVKSNDALQVTLKNGYMLKLPLQIDSKNLPCYSSFYAMSGMTEREASNHDINKSPTLLLINEEACNEN